MVALNKILNILILVLAIVALVFGFLLSQKRQQLRTHSDQLGTTLENVVANIAPNTDLSNKVNYNNGDGSLGFDQLDQFEQLSQEINNHATALVKQRDDLGAAVADVATKFNVIDEAQPGDFQSMATYADQLQTLNDGVSAINNRNNDFISTLSSIGSTVDAPADEATLTDPEAYAAPLERIATGVTTLADRNSAYISALESVVTRLGSERLGVSAEELRDPENFEKAEIQLENGLLEVANSLAEYDAAQKQIAELETTVADTEQRWQEERRNVQIARQQLDDVNRRKAELETEVADLREQVGDIETRDTGILKGKVVEVNYEWNYAIIDLGRTDGLPPNLTMTVGRDREFIANVLVSKVYGDYAVAEILTENKQGEVLEGDRVFYVSGPLSAN